MVWTDPATGLAWEVIDFRYDLATKKRVPLGDWGAAGRAFVPHDRPGEIRIYHFGRSPHYALKDKFLANQLHFSRALPVAHIGTHR